jgi:hypothetical protein
MDLGPYTLDWADVPGATGYYVDVVGESSPPNPYWVTESEVSSTWNGDHCPMLWRVKAVCGADTSEYSETWSIWVACPGCNVPELLSPPDSSVGYVGEDYTLRWSVVPGAEGYYVDVVGEQNPYWVTQPEFSSHWDGPHCPMEWRVRAVCGADTSEYSETWSIWVDCPVAVSRELKQWGAIKNLFRD